MNKEPTTIEVVTHAGEGTAPSTEPVHLVRAEVDGDLLMDALAIVRHFPESRPLSIEWRKFLEAELENPTPGQEHPHVIVLEVQFWAVLRGLAYLGEMVKRLGQEEAALIAKRIHSKFPRKSPNENIAFLNQMTSCASDVLSAIYECLIYLLIRGTAGFKPEFRSDKSQGGCDLVVEHARILIECKDMQGTAMRLPLTDADCDNLARKIGEAQDQIDKSNPNGEYRPLIFIDLQDELAQDIKANGGFGDMTLERLLSRSRHLGHVLFSSFDLLGHARKDTDPAAVITRMFLYAPSYRGTVDGQPVNLRPGYVQDLQRQLQSTKVIDWKAGAWPSSNEQAAPTG